MKLAEWALSCVAIASLIGCAKSECPATAQTTPSAPRAAGNDDWRSDRTDPLASRMQESARHLQSRGWQAAEDQQRGFVVVGTNTTVPIHVPANTCLAWLSLGSTGIRDLDATLFSPEGDVLAEDVEEDAHPTVAACADDSARDYYLVLRAYAGAGAYLVGSFRGSQERLSELAAALGGKPGVASASAPELAVDARVRVFNEGMARRGFAHAHDTFRIPVRAGAWVRSALPVESGHCYTVAVLAEGAVTDAQVRLLDAAGQTVGSDESASLDAAAQFCSTASEQASFEVMSRAGDGAVLVAIWDGAAADVGGSGGLWLGIRPAAR